MNSTRPTCGGDRNVGRVEFTDSTHGQASQGACLAGMGRSPVYWLLCPGGKGDGQSYVNGGRNLDLARFRDRVGPVVTRRAGCVCGAVRTWRGHTSVLDGLVAGLGAWFRSPPSLQLQATTRRRGKYEWA